MPIIHYLDGSQIYQSYTQLRLHYPIWKPVLEQPQNTFAHAVLLQKYPQLADLNEGINLMSKAVPRAVKTKVVEKMEPLVPPKGFTFGADPELFIKDENGVVVGPDMVPGTKDEPYKVKHGAVQRDGMAAEYNIDPCATYEEWNRNHKAVQGQLQDMLPKGYTLVAEPAVRFSPEVFNAAPDTAKQLGCSPDWNAWNASINPPPCPPEDDPYLRCAGGHLHFGLGEGYDADVHDVQHMMNCFDLSKQLDWFLGAWALKHDKDTDRKKLYGRAGSCRIKPYGPEYRVLSNFWVLDKALRLEVWNRAVMAVKCMSNYFLPEQLGNEWSTLIQTSINSGKTDRSLASVSFPINNLQCPVPLLN